MRMLRYRLRGVLHYLPLAAEHPEEDIEHVHQLRVSSRRGSIVLRANVTHKTTVGVVFIPFHFREAAANVLTNPALDPFGKIPEFKFCAVKVEAAEAA